MHRAQDSVVDVQTRYSGSCPTTAVSAAGTRPVSGVRTRARRRRRRQFGSGRLRTGRARGVQHPSVNGHAFARATDRPNPDGSYQTQTSRRVSFFGHLLVRTGLLIDGNARSCIRRSRHARPRGPPPPDSRTVGPSGRGEGIVSVFHSRNSGHIRSPGDFGTGMILGMVW